MVFEQKLDNSLLLRTVRDENDIQAYADFNTAFNNPHEGVNSNLLLRYFPGSCFEDYQLIEDEQSGQIVATTCLIPWEIHFEGVTLRAAQLEQVLSHPDYRHHGLVKTQIKRFMQVVRERRCDLSFIWGIPYYYRQYGYSYCMDGNVFEILPVGRIPEAPAGADHAYRLRPAGPADVLTLTKLYRQTMQSVPLHMLRKAEHWHYLLERAGFPVQIIEENRSGRAVGYIGCKPLSNNAGFHIFESGGNDPLAAMAALQALKVQSEGEVRVSWPRSGALARVARSLGSSPNLTGQWLFHITDPTGFLTRIGPVLERRLASAGCANLSQEILINLFRQAYRLNFEAGKLAKVEAVGFVDSSMGADGGDLCIPPDAFVRLVLGYRGLDELLDAWPDIVIKPRSRHLLDVLFPKFEAYLYATYEDFG